MCDLITHQYQHSIWKYQKYLTRHILISFLEVPLCRFGYYFRNIKSSRSLEISTYFPYFFQLAMMPIHIYRDSLHVLLGSSLKIPFHPLNKCDYGEVKNIINGNRKHTIWLLPYNPKNAHIVYLKITLHALFGSNCIRRLHINCSFLSSSRGVCYKK